MKNIKKVILGLGILSTGLLSAQNSQMTNMLKVGVNGGVAVPSSNASANVGVDVAYQNLVTPGFDWVSQLVIISFLEKIIMVIAIVISEWFLLQL